MWHKRRNGIKETLVGEQKKEAPFSGTFFCDIFSFKCCQTNRSFVLVFPIIFWGEAMLFDTWNLGRWNQCHLQWKRGVLTTGLSGKSCFFPILVLFFSNLNALSLQCFSRGTGGSFHLVKEYLTSSGVSHESPCWCLKTRLICHSLAKDSSESFGHSET